MESIKRHLRGVGFLFFTLALIGAIPHIYRFAVVHMRPEPFANISEQFPVTVDPARGTINENPQVNAFLSSPDSPLQASVDGIKGIVLKILASASNFISSLPVYQSLAAADERVVTLNPGLRKEQVAAAFGKELNWSVSEQQHFLTKAPQADLPLSEGSFLPGSYVLAMDAAPADAQQLVNDQFRKEILSHYGDSISHVVPLSQALTIASIIQRETLGTDDMRLVSGILWNRIFTHMNLQVDSTLQYAKSTGRPTKSWWPTVTPADKYIKSDYNTYAHAGLPPGPIANPSVAAVLAALNPLKTSCIYYFNDPKGNIICSNTYPEHVKKLKQYYGQGK